MSVRGWIHPAKGSLLPLRRGERNSTTAPQSVANSFGSTAMAAYTAGN